MTHRHPRADRVGTVANRLDREFFEVVALLHDDGADTGVGGHRCEVVFGGLAVAAPGIDDQNWSVTLNARVAVGW